MPLRNPRISPRWLFALTLSALLVMGARLGAQGAPGSPVSPGAAAPAGAPVTPPPATAAGAAAGTAPAAAAGAPAPRPRESWTADRRSFIVGDIVTVLIDDYTISTAVKENIASDQRTRELGANAQLPTSSKRVGIDTRNGATQQQRGSARRENRFQNEMSVRVVAVGPNGLLQLRGTKKIDVDKAKQDIEFSGWVRAQDISPQNYVESNRVADATIAYASPGNLARPKQGILTKVLGALWP